MLTSRCPPQHPPSFPTLRSSDLWNTSMPTLPTISTRPPPEPRDGKSTRLNSGHLVSSYAVLCLKKKTLQVGEIADDERAWVRDDVSRCTVYLDRVVRLLCAG